MDDIQIFFQGTVLNTNGVTSHHGGQLEAASRQQNGHHSSLNGGSGENIVQLTELLYTSGSEPIISLYLTVC